MRAIFSVLLTVATVQFVAASKDTLHLARQEGAEIKVEIKPGTKMEFVLADAMTTEAYTVTVARRNVLPDLIPLSPFKSLAAGGGACPALSGPFAALDAAVSETEVADAMSALSAAVKGVLDAPAGGCTVALAKQTMAGALDRTTRRVPGTHLIGEGEEVTVKIIRKGTDANGAEKEFKWTFIYTTGARGAWVVTYGFNAIIGVAMPERRYFTQSLDTMFVIKQRKAGSPLTYAPTVMVHWMPRVREQKAIAWSLSAGLGIGNEMPTLTLGGGLVIHHNIALHLGMALHAQDRLNGKYAEGDLVREDLDDSQLHERQLAVDPFFGISFRFDKSPFAKEDAKKDQ